MDYADLRRLICGDWKSPLRMGLGDWKSPLRMGLGDWKSPLRVVCVAGGQRRCISV